ncbi:hypothetical protein WJX81_003586 [Elliptochloris bilobata]|uniref:Protein DETOXIFICATION n=1 Tax=Elliptochloris bilobata TaxID=381761 RepID=A0AAW1RKD5_9CHLO
MSVQQGESSRLLPPSAVLSIDAASDLGPGPRVPFGKEAARLLALAWPISLLNLLQYVANQMPIGFVGHLDSFSLSVAVLSWSILNVSGYALLMGTAAALETLCGQAYGGKQYQQLGYQLQRSLLISLVMVLLICGLWMQLHPILLLLGQDPRISAATTRYLWLCVPSLPCIAAGECMRRYLLAQNSVLPSTLATLGATVLAPLYAWALIFLSGLDLDGAALACDLINATNAALLLGYLVWRERRLAGTPQQTWHGWSREAWCGWGTYLRIALPSLAMTVGEMWAFEVMILLAGMLPDPERSVDVMGIAFTFGGAVYMVPLGLSGAVSARIANELGAGEGLRARSVARAGTTLAAATLLGAAAAVLACRHQYGWIFSNSEEVVAMLARVLLFVAALVVGDGVAAVQAGVVRGAGRQNWAAAMNLGTYWALGVPLAAWLAFRQHKGVFGLWAGIVIATNVQAVAMTVLVGAFDWPHEAQRACELVGEARGGACRDGKEPSARDIEFG